MFTQEQIKKAVKSKGYIYFDSPKNYDVNIIGIRCNNNDKVTNLFDKFLFPIIVVGSSEYCQNEEGKNDVGPLPKAPLAYYCWLVEHTQLQVSVAQVHPSLIVGKVVDAIEYKIFVAELLIHVFVIS